MGTYSQRNENRRKGIGQLVGVPPAERQIEAG
jgi:hypothetical protein